VTNQRLYRFSDGAVLGASHLLVGGTWRGDGFAAILDAGEIGSERHDPIRVEVLRANWEARGVA
jgi:hypothetical protein